MMPESDNTVFRLPDMSIDADLLCRKIPEGMLAGYFDMDTPVCFINDYMLEYLGYADQIEFNQATDGICLNFVHPLDRERVVSEISEQYNRGDRVYRSAYRVLKKDGSYMWMMAKSSVIDSSSDRALMVSTYVDITDKQRLLERANRAELMLKAAVKHINAGVWEYDIKNKRLIHVYSLPRFNILPTVIENIPDSVVQSGMIHEDSVQDFINIFKRIDEGALSASTELKLCFAELEHPVWERVVLNIIKDAEGCPLNGIFISEDITAEKEAEFKYQHELQLRNTVSLGFIAAVRVNLSKGIVEFVQVDSQRWGQPEPNMSYERMMSIESSYIVNKEDAERYNTFFDRENLLKGFNAGKKNISLDYRRAYADGKITWVNIGIKLVKDTVSGDIYAYGGIRDISEQKHIELSLRQRAEYDTLTGAYNRDTARIMIADAAVAADKEGKDFCIMLFSVDNFSKIVHKNGYAAGDAIVKELCAVLNAELEEPKIIGRLFGDEMIVWLGANPDKDIVLSKAEKVRTVLKRSPVVPKIGMEISISVGIAFSKKYGRDSKVLTHKAQDALFVCKEIGGNCCIVRDEKLSAIDEKQKQQAAYVQCDLNAIITRCAFALTYSGEYDKAVQSVLRDIIDYYGAECACLIEIDPRSKQARDVHTHGKRSENCENNTWDGLAERVKSVLGKEKRIFVDNAEVGSPIQKELFKKFGVHGGYFIALETSNGINGYLSLSNPTLQNGDITLLNLLACIFANDIDKRQAKERQEYLYSYDEFTGLLNRNSYLNFISGYLVDSAMSLGVAVADINGLKQINAQYGRSIGDELVSFVAKALNDVPDGRAFRLSGDEFVLICENVTQDAFYKHMENLRRVLDDEYPEGVAVGHAWTDTDINHEQLVMQADEKMMISKQIYYKDGIRIIKRRDIKAERVLIDDIRDGRYEVYLQPKAVVNDGAISGAEALIRYRNADGELIPPLRFIPQLEQTGNIYHIDIFVFEEVCRMLKRWQQENKKIIPISLNFSRITLLRENLLADMEEIYRRYQVPKNLIEIEVSESMGSVERQTLVDISADIVRNGYTLSLDDFGAKYSNLSILSVLDLHVLKLDKSLVNDLLSNNNTRKVLRNFLKTCSDLNIVSVAEGVETKEQLEILKELGCDYAQGYYFNKPIPLNDFEKMYLESKS